MTLKALPVVLSHLAAILLVSSDADELNTYLNNFASKRANQVFTVGKQRTPMKEEEKTVCKRM